MPHVALILPRVDRPTQMSTSILHESCTSVSRNGGRTYLKLLDNLLVVYTASFHQISSDHATSCTLCRLWGSVSSVCALKTDVNFLQSESHHCGQCPSLRVSNTLWVQDFVVEFHNLSLSFLPSSVNGSQLSRSGHKIVLVVERRRKLERTSSPKSKLRGLTKISVTILSAHLVQRLNETCEH